MMMRIIGAYDGDSTRCGELVQWIAFRLSLRHCPLRQVTSARMVIARWKRRRASSPFPSTPITVAIALQPSARVATLIELVNEVHTLKD